MFTKVNYNRIYRFFEEYENTRPNFICREFILKQAFYFASKKISRIFSAIKKQTLLNSLSIKNFALIEDVELVLQNNLSIITGETGAGKSILLGALSLLLGKRADLASLKNPEDKCIIEGVFSIGNFNLQELFSENDLDYEPVTIIRREILPSGKSRAFINDTPVNLQQMSNLGKHLVDIHSQNETLFLGDNDYQYNVIDVLSGNSDLADEFKNALKEYRNLRKKWEEQQARQLEANKTYDYHLFLLNELLNSNLQPGIQEELEEKYQQLSNVEELKENLSASIQKINQEDFGISDSLNELRTYLNSLEKFGKKYQDFSERLKSLSMELSDIVIDLERLFDDVEDDPQALEKVDLALQNIYNLQKKHGVATVEELLEIQEDLSQKVSDSELADENNEKLKKEILKAEKKADEIAGKLMQARLKAIPGFTRSVEETLAQLGMPYAQLKINLEKSEDFNSYGKDEMNWLFSANKGGRLQEMRKSASGGEMSRIALAVKSILAQYSNLPTLIFDEIDTGVSGEIAKKMGDIMAEMGNHLQVISITHLPQIAAKGKHHFKVLKEIQKGETRTTIMQLDESQRIDELAEMLGGKEKSESAIAHARDLLK